MKTLDDYAKELKTDNFLKAAHQAKERSHELFEAQGIATLSLLISEFLVDVIKASEKWRGRIHEPNFFPNKVRDLIKRNTKE